MVIIATLEKAQETMIDKLESLGFNNIYGMNDKFYKKLKWGNSVFQNEEIIYSKRYIAPYIKCLMDIVKDYQNETVNIKLYIEQALQRLEWETLNIARLVVVLGNKCSLRCKECNNLIPYFKPQKELDSNKILSSLEILSSRAETILKCELIGGEPFLSNNLNKVLKFLIERENIYRIEITTNGTILPKQEQIPLLQNRKVVVRVSDYGILVNKDKIIYFLKQNGISYKVLEGGKWVENDLMDSGMGINELKKVYNNCEAGYLCKTLYEDKIFACPRASSLYVLGYMQEQEYVRISEEISAEDLKDFLLRPYSVACNLCRGSGEPVFVEPAVQFED